MAIRQFGDSEIRKFHEFSRSFAYRRESCARLLRLTREKRLRAFTACAAFQAWRPAPSRIWHLKLMTLSVWCAKANRLSTAPVAAISECGWD